VLLGPPVSTHTPLSPATGQAPRASDPAPPLPCSNRACRRLAPRPCRGWDAARLSAPGPTTERHHVAPLLPDPPSILSHVVFKTKTRCSSYVCSGSSCHTYGQNVSTKYQCLYYIVSYYKSLLQVQKGLNNGMDPILPHAVDRGFCTPRRNLHPHTPHLLSSRT
jgi:hypothetical protein